MGHARISQYAVLIIILLLLFLLSGCHAKQQFSFEDTEILAYVQGQQVKATEVQQYTDMAKLYWEKIKSTANDLTSDNETIDTPEQEIVMFMTNDIKADAEKYAGYTDIDWKENYYKMLVIEQQQSSIDKNSIEGIDYLTNDTVQEIIDTGSFYYLDTDIDFSEILEMLGDKYNMTKEECANNICKPFFKLLACDEYFHMYFGKNLFKGSFVEWDGTNIDEYKEYLSQNKAQYNEYTTKLAEEADIVERT